MRVLIDECLPRKLKVHLQGHNCLTAREVGFGGLKNGVLLAAAERAGFDVLLTVDKGFEYSQNFIGRRLGCVVIHAKSNRMRDLLPLVPRCLDELATIRPGELRHVWVESQNDSAGLAR